MAALDPLLVVGGVLLLFFLPGYLLLHAVFPRRRWFGAYHLVAVPTLSVLFSVTLLILVGSLLGFLPGSPTGDGRGWFQGHRTGAPILEAALGGLSLLLFLVASGRGAFPLLSRPAGRPHPRDEWRDHGEPEEVTQLRDLRLEEERLRREADRLRRRAHESRDAGVRTALSEAAADLENDRRGVAARARELERRAGERRSGAVARRR